jgi:hypothetical protein
VHLGVVLVVLVEQLAGELELIGFLVVPASNEHLEPLLLEVGEVKLGHINYHD